MSFNGQRAQSEGHKGQSKSPHITGVAVLPTVYSLRGHKCYSPEGRKAGPGEGLEGGALEWHSTEVRGWNSTHTQTHGHTHRQTAALTLRKSSCAVWVSRPPCCLWGEMGTRHYRSPRQCRRGIQWSCDSTSHASNFHLTACY